VVGKLSLIQLCSFNYDMVLGLRGLLQNAVVQLSVCSFHFGPLVQIEGRINLKSGGNITLMHVMDIPIFRQKGQRSRIDRPVDILNRHTESNEKICCGHSDNWLLTI